MKRQTGFTLIELMIVIVIIGILVAIALPNLAAAQKRARVASVKSNMKVTQTMAETYGVDWGGTYAGTRDQLHNEAVANGYWKEFKSPLTGHIDPINDTNDLEAKIENRLFMPGGVIYVGSECDLPDESVPPFDRTTYFIIGLDETSNAQEELRPIEHRGQIFFLTNQ